MVIDVAPAPIDEGVPPVAAEELAPAPRRFGPPAPGPAAIVLAVVMTLSVVAVFFGVFAFGLSGLQEERSQHQLYASFRGLVDPSSPVAPSIGGSIRQGTPVALLSAPKAGLRDVVVVEGTSSADLLAGPGHLRSSPLPGQAGESVILGKGATAGAPFRGITRLRAGDVVTVRTGQGRFRFVVKGQLVAGERPPSIRAGEGLLVLATSAGGLTPGHLLYVDAKLKGKAVPAPAGRPRTVSSAEVPGHGDPGAWPLVAAWLAGLLVASAACWWLWSRWGMLRTWIVGVPVLFALLWGLSNEAMRLLPNVY